MSILTVGQLKALLEAEIDDDSLIVDWGPGQIHFNTPGARPHSGLANPEVARRGKTLAFIDLYSGGLLDNTLPSSERKLILPNLRPFALRRSRNAWRAACVFGLLCALAISFVEWRMMR